MSIHVAVSWSVARVQGGIRACNDAICVTSLNVPCSIRSFIFTFVCPCVC